MDRMIAYSTRLVREAEAIAAATDEDERRRLPLTSPPKSWWPGKYSNYCCDRLTCGVDDLHATSRAIREKGFSRITKDGEPVESYNPQDLLDAIQRVKNLLNEA